MPGPSHDGPGHGFAELWLAVGVADSTLSPLERELRTNPVNNIGKTSGEL